MVEHEYKLIGLGAPDRADISFLAERKPNGQLMVQVQGSDGQVVNLRQEKRGGVPVIEFYPGLTCSYDHDGRLRRLTWRLKDFILGLNNKTSKLLPVDLRDFVRMLVETKSDALVSVGFDEDFFRVIKDFPGGQEKMVETKLYPVAGAKVEVVDPSTGLRRADATEAHAMNAMLFIVLGDNGFSIGFGLSDEDPNFCSVVFGGFPSLMIMSLVRKNIDLSVLDKGELTEDDMKAMLATGPREMQTIKRSLW